MENQNVKRKPGRPKKYLTEEDKKNAYRPQKTYYMLNKEWYCDVCRNGHNYTLSGKWMHLKSKKHKYNYLYLGYITSDQQSKAV